MTPEIAGELLTALRRVPEDTRQATMVKLLEMEARGPLREPVHLARRIARRLQSKDARQARTRAYGGPPEPPAPLGMLGRLVARWELAEVPARVTLETNLSRSQRSIQRARRWAQVGR